MRRSPQSRRRFHPRSATLAAGAAIALAIAGIAAPLQAAFMKPPYPYRAKEFALVFDGERFHVFYIRNSYNLPPDSTEIDYGHAVSYDLSNWTQLDPILPVRPGSWDNLHVWSPTIVKRDSTWFLFYAGVTHVPGVYERFQRIGLATSTDLMNWTRLDQPVLGCSQVPWVYCDSSDVFGGDFRDPVVLPDPAAPGGWLMYYATRPDAARDEMVLGVASSSGDLTQWTDRMPMWNTDPFHSFSPLIEAPAMFDHDGLWYLFYDTNSGHTINYETSTDPVADSSGWSNQRHLSSEILSEDTDPWFGPEFLRLPGHDFFGAVNSASDAIEFREIVWGEAPHFGLIDPSAAGLAVGPGATADLELRLAARPGPHRFRFEIITGTPRHARLDLLDLAGRRVARLADRDLAIGATVIEWDGRDQSGREVSAGVFFARLQCADRVRTARLAVVR